MASAFSAYHGAPKSEGSHFTVTALSRWSILTKQLPGSSCCIAIFGLMRLDASGRVPCRMMS
jgi:hypothetical protein